VQQCRSVIEAHGMKIAQARRKLTAHTARQPFKAVRSGESTTALWPAPVSDVAGTEITPADLDPPAVAEVPEPAPTELDVPGPDTHTATEGTSPPQPGPPAPADGARGGLPAPGRPPAGSRRPSEATPTLRHSVQARRTAERLRAAYAAKASF